MARGKLSNFKGRQAAPFKKGGGRRSKATPRSRRMY